MQCLFTTFPFFLCLSFIVVALNLTCLVTFIVSTNVYIRVLCQALCVGQRVDEKWYTNEVTQPTVLKGHNANTWQLKVWERELGFEITDEDWENSWCDVQTQSACNRVKATQLMILHRAHISPHQSQKYKPAVVFEMQDWDWYSYTPLLVCSKVLHFWNTIGLEVIVCIYYWAWLILLFMVNMIDNFLECWLSAFSSEFDLWEHSFQITTA